MPPINIYLANHSAYSQEALRDLVDPVAHGLERCGLTVTYSDALSTDGINLLVEAFDQTMMETLRSRKYRYGLMCTETLETGLLNGDETNRERARCLIGAIEFADFVWYLTGGDYERLSDKARKLTLLYDPDSLWPADDDANPEYDFTAYGNVTIERTQFCEELQRRGFSVSWVKRFIPKAARDAQVRNAKRVINFTANGGNGRSHTREWAAIHLRRALVGQTPLAWRFQHWDWREEAAVQLAVYKRRGDMQMEIRNLLNASGL